MKLIPGQRWISDMEPELGLGVLLGSRDGKIQLTFPAADVTRVYSVESAPVRRAIVRVGRPLVTHEGRELMVESREDDDGIVVYHCEGGEVVSEDELSDTMSFSQPEERLLAGRVDHFRDFRLRAETLYRARQMYASPVRGLLGARVDLIPHQLGIVEECAGRLAPRVLLADEVGLGKTIEACLIMHRLHVTGRAERVLVVVPDALVHQWFVELLRRFNMLFALFDEERCLSIEAGDAEANPFLDSQLVLCPLSLLVGNAKRSEQVVAAGWGLLIVDEAHHLEWSRDGASADYALIDRLAQATPSVLLLTATPQQLGRDGHFARLRLLEPDRFTDIDAFYAEADRYEQVAADLESVQSGGEIGDVSAYPARIQELAKEETKDGDELAEALLASFGTGRIMFRNERKNLEGFPERRLHLLQLDSMDEWGAKVEWLCKFLRENENKKVLVIVSALELVLAVEEMVREQMTVNLAVFHEELSLIQRDRNAAYFAEEDGARVLFCSEIGSEGRNFQFAQDLVLLDLPYDPGLLEQRIGRLDRIGQTGTINIHVPVLADSEELALARWYHEGLGAFERSVAGAAEVLERLGEDWQMRLEAGLDTLIAETREHLSEVSEQMESGHDRLLALSSRGRMDVAETVEKIEKWDDDVAFEEWIMRLLDHFGLKVEGLGDRTYLLHPGNVQMGHFPDLPDEGMCVTLDRERALSREELVFLSADHPIVRSAVEMLLSSESGNSSFGVWMAPGTTAIILECYYVVECLAPPAYHIDRFLAPRPVRVACDQSGKDWTGDAGLVRAKLRNGSHQKLLSHPQVTQDMLPKMLAKSASLAEAMKGDILTKARAKAEAAFEAEISRLETLAQLNDLVNESEIAQLQARAEETDQLLQKARVRLDTVRLIFRDGK